MPAFLRWFVLLLVVFDLFSSPLHAHSHDLGGSNDLEHAAELSEAHVHATFKDPAAADKSKETLYMFFTLQGNLIASNFSGKQALLSVARSDGPRCLLPKPHPVLPCRNFDVY